MHFQKIKKITLSFVIAVRKMRLYFQGYCQVLKKPHLEGRIMSWAIEILEYNIQYIPRGGVKSQALADFVAEFNSFVDEETPLEWVL